jgi:hypothetical protein
MKSLERIAAESAKHVKPGQSFGDLCAEHSWPIGWGEMLEEWARDPDFEFCDDCREKLLDTIEQALPKRNRVLVSRLRDLPRADCARGMRLSARPGRWKEGEPCSS